ncbi:PAP/fibrillin family protein [Myxosarcina sp. GI1]|uniref:PAP/fibrillin family protein n=1 Tax=Myxosarcina sp. GI1 TaxID=1541065 RepID=UPI0005690434|nr:PAP/fibrillin family protein [Myxosarcina sp. GI1]
MTANRDLKAQLFSQIETIGKERSILPFSDTSIDDTIRRLENVNPMTQPLASDNLSSLVGDWQLVYASNGTVVTRPIAEMTNVLGTAIKVNKIWQSLAVLDEKIKADNQALIELPLLGEYKLSAEGVWQPEPDQQAAMVMFDAFTAQAIKFLGQSDWTLPELKIPVLEFLRNEALWITSYLDEDTRIGRGKTGNLFVFCR